MKRHTTNTNGGVQTSALKLGKRKARPIQGDPNENYNETG